MFNEEDGDLYALIFTGPLILMGAIGGLSGWITLRGHEATAWLMQNNILVPAEQATITIMDAGLDPARLVLLGALAFFALWATIAGARRARNRRI